MRHVAEAHGGQVTVDSTPGRGRRFTLWLLAGEGGGGHFPRPTVTMPRILIVDDEPEIVRGLEDNFRFEGYETLAATNGGDALRLAATEGPDRVLGLELGADDYVTKPFSLRELLARVRAVLRRPGPRRKSEEISFGDVRIQRRSRRVFKAGREAAMTRKEFDLLVYLVEHRGEVVTRERLLDEVWGYERFPTTRTVDTHVLRLRRKLDADADQPVWILTVHAQGYRFATS